MVAVLAGAAVQSGYNFLTNDIIPFLTKNISLRTEDLRIRLLYLGLIGILVSTLVISFNYRQSDFLRRFRYDEFPVTRTNQRKVYNYLTEHMRPNDIILTNSQTSFYLIYYQLPNQPSITYTSWFLRKYAWKGFNCFDIMCHYGFDKIEIVTGALRGINKHFDLEKGSKVWLVNIGWGGDEIETFLSKDPEYRFLFNKELSVEGGCIHSVKTEDIGKWGPSLNSHAHQQS
jgi:hypothetical protein